MKNSTKWWVAIGIALGMVALMNNDRPDPTGPSGTHCPPDLTQEVCEELHRLTDEQFED